MLMVQIFSRPGQPLLDRIDHDSGQSFRTFSIALPRHTTLFGAEPDLAAHMLIAEADDTAPGQPVGTSCRICTRGDCPSRTEAPLLA